MYLYYLKYVCMCTTPIEGIYINYDYTIKLILLLSSADFCAILNSSFTKSISFCQ